MSKTNLQYHNNQIYLLFIVRSHKEIVCIFLFNWKTNIIPFVDSVALVSSDMRQN